MYILYWDPALSSWICDDFVIFITNTSHIHSFYSNSFMLFSFFLSNSWHPCVWVNEYTNKKGKEKKKPTEWERGSEVVAAASEVELNRIGVAYFMRNKAAVEFLVDFGTSVVLSLAIPLAFRFMFLMFCYWHWKIFRISVFFSSSYAHILLLSQLFIEMNRIKKLKIRQRKIDACVCVWYRICSGKFNNTYSRLCWVNFHRKLLLFHQMHEMKQT